MLLSGEAWKRIPVLAIGILFSFRSAAGIGGVSSRLANELLIEGDCAYALREAHRALTADAADAVARAVAVAARCRLGRPVDAADAVWFRSIAEAGRGEASAIAAREMSGATPPRRSAWSAPSAWIVRIYRRGIGPGIAQRCSLDPSCSQYFLEAGRRHGLLAFPLQADRFVREPGVVKEAARPVRGFGVTRYEDPVGDHDFWLTPPPRRAASAKDGNRP